VRDHVAVGDLRLLSYNVKSLRMSRRAVVQVIRECDPDVLCLQEAPRFLFWRWQSWLLARRAGLRVVAGHARAGAVLVLARPGLPVASRGRISLPLTPGRHRRGVAHAVFAVGGGQVVVASVHMSLYADERSRHLPLIRAEVERFGAPVVIAGDINEEPGHAVWDQLAAAYQDGYAVAPDGGGPTFSSWKPLRRIDAVFVDRSLQVVGCGVPDIAAAPIASDHCPLLAVLEL
jgi:endonuclease/exonuclease/phosphatase family metal-dependent hydrolase